MKKVLIVLLALILTPIVAYSYFVLQSYLQGQDLTVDKAHIETVYRFRFPAGREVVIRDKFSKINRFEPQYDYVHVKGYMGVYVQDLNFTVDKNGIISSDNWHGG